MDTYLKGIITKYVIKWGNLMFWPIPDRGHWSGEHSAASTDAEFNLAWFHVKLCSQFSISPPPFPKYLKRLGVPAETPAGRFTGNEKKNGMTLKLTGRSEWFDSFYIIPRLSNKVKLYNLWQCFYIDWMGTTCGIRSSVMYEKQTIYWS